ncbi:MAG: rhodanese-like domain-containing protein [Oscillibacter sp.]|jgi:rhodanese-related sulfurtransferase|nr:rhodanese-like domain-containing protein [Oscillibacter sp.]
MKLLSTALLLTLAVLGLSACGAKNGSGASSAPSSSTDAVYHALTPEEAKARLDSGDALVLLDVRTQEEFDEGHIAGAICLPNETIGTDPPEVLPDKDAEILVYCRSGRRSKEAAKKLVAMGYTQVYDFGGILDWPYETVTE